MGLQTNKLYCFRPTHFSGDYGDSLETRKTAMIKTKRFMVNGKNVAFRFPKRRQATRKWKMSKIVYVSKLTEARFLDERKDSKNAEISKGSINLRYLI